MPLLLSVAAASDLVSVLGAEHGWVLLLALFLWELFCPLPFHDTKLQTVFLNFDAKTEELKEENVETRDKLDNIQKQQVHLIQIVRAIARENDEIDDARVDSYLVHNGVPVFNFQEDPSEEQIQQDKEEIQMDD